MKAARDLLAGSALGDQLDDLELARGERILRRRFSAAGAIEIVAHQCPDGRRVQERLAPHGRPAGLDQIPVRRVFST